ncbi:MAG: hypothetical protein ACP5C3_07305 [Methanomicrobiales archaeon]
MTHNRPKAKRIHLTFSEEQWKILEKFKGVMGQGDAEIVRNIVLAWLAEKSMISTEIKSKEKLNNE